MRIQYKTERSQNKEIDEVTGFSQKIIVIKFNKYGHDGKLKYSHSYSLDIFLFNDTSKT
ncbi:MAG: hypothetical protein PHR78_04100 [Eubacteriales bacterium]|nr:hypothetical protein [Eubacteriales bacterium]